MKRGTPQHPKTKALARSLAVPVYSAVGLLEMLWHFTAEFAPQGNVGRFSNQDIADALGWVECPDRLVDALLAARWIEQHKTHRLVVHDWHDHADDASHMKLARQTHFFADGKMPRISRFPQSERTAIEAAYARLAHDTRMEAHGNALPSPPLPSPPPPNTAQPSVAAPVVQEKASKPSKSNPMWDAVVMAFNLPTATKAQRSRIGKIVTGFNEMAVTPEEVTLRAKRYRERWPGKTCSGEALQKWWNEFGHDAPTDPEDTGSMLHPYENETDCSSEAVQKLIFEVTGVGPAPPGTTWEQAVRASLAVAVPGSFAHRKWTDALQEIEAKAGGIDVQP